ncbi:MAG: tetratricopeptide repeat protein [Ignavibacteria bacterium]
MTIIKKYRILIVSAFAMLFLICNTAISQDNLKDGISAVKKGDYLKALPLLKMAMESGNTYDANYYYSYALFKTGSLSDAEKFARTAVGIDDERPEAFSVMGEIYSEQKRYSDAESNFETAVKYLPLNKTKDDLTPEEIKTIVDVLSRQAENYIAEGKVDKAITSLSIAKTYDNNNPILLTGLGDSYLKRGAFEVASSNYNAAIKANSSFAPAYYGLGMIAFRQKKYNDALDNFTKAITADPNFSEAYYERGLVLYLAEKLEQALDDFTKYSDLKPGSTLGLTFYAKTQLALGKLDEAMTLIDKVLTTEPNNSEANKVKAAIYIEKKDYQNAQSYYNKVKPEDLNSEDQMNIGKIYTNLKDFPKAYEHFQSAVKLDSTDENVYFEYAKAQFSNQEYEASIVNLNKAIELGLGQRNVGVYVYKGISYYYMKDYDNAIPQFQKCLDTSPSANISALCYLWVGNTYAAMGGKRQEAIDAYKKCLEFDANNQDAKDGIQRLGGQ